MHGGGGRGAGCDCDCEVAVKTSAIGWTDFSGGDLNFVTGCTPVSEGCQNCYARAIYERWGKDHSIVTAHEDKLNRLARAKFPEHSPKRGKEHRPMAFVCDTGDLFHESVPDDFIMYALEVLESRPDVIWQVLTKRPERMRETLRMGAPGASLRENVWLGVTAENQRRANERIPLLLDTPAAVRFVSVEPMLGEVDLRGGSGEIWPWAEAVLNGQGIDWVICGAESGPHRRPFKVEWAQELYEQCKDAAVPFFGKQDSGSRPGTPLLIEEQIIHEWPE